MNEKLDQQYFDVNFDFNENKYESIKNIGNGAYGVVCLARHRKTGTHVAIKKIVNAFEHFVIGMRTYREIKILRHLIDHENIITIRDLFLNSNNNNNNLINKDVYIVFDYMDTDLRKILQSNQILTNDHIKYFIYQILNGINFIHQAGIIHRDLKPSNILVSQTCIVKIADFGMARQYRDHDQTQYVVTRWYRAPEVILGYMDYTQAIDLWSIGCILAEMFGRKPIFAGTDIIAQIQLIFIILGTPTKAYLSSLHSDCFRRLITSVGNRPPANFKALFPNATEDGIDLLRQLLVIDPENRLSANVALKQNFVKEFGTTIENIDENMMEIEAQKFDFGFESEKWTLDQLQRTIQEEIDHFQPRTSSISIDELSNRDQIDNSSRQVIIVDTTPPPTAIELEIDNTRPMMEKKRKHRRRKNGHLQQQQHHHHSSHSKRSHSIQYDEEQSASGSTPDEDIVHLS